jgi:hypothetical protein
MLESTMSALMCWVLVLVQVIELWRWVLESTMEDVLEPMCLAVVFEQVVMEE